MRTLSQNFQAVRKCLVISQSLLLSKFPFPLITCWEILHIKVWNILRKKAATEVAVKNLPHFIFGHFTTFYLCFINLTLETLSRTHMVNKGKNKQEKTIR